jgi:hypothetical protein
MDVSKFNSVGDWYTASKEEGFSVPLQAAHILSTIMEKDNLSFFEAYTKAINERGIKLDGDIYFADLAYLTRLLSETRKTS